MKKIYSIGLVAMGLVATASFAYAQRPAPAKPMAARPAVAPAPKRPTLAEVQNQVNRKLAHVVVQRRRGEGFGICAAAAAAEKRYEACETKCADWAGDQPLTASDLQACGDKSATDCAELLIDKKGDECISRKGNPGCADEKAALVKANETCRECIAQAAKLQALRKQKIAKLVEIRKLEKALVEAKASMKQIDDQLLAEGKPCGRRVLEVKVPEGDKK